MLIAQITDCHIVRDGVLVYGAVDTAAHLARAVAALNRLDPQPDVVLLTGDLVNDGTTEEYARLRGIISALKAPFRLIPGNHDRREGLREAFGDHPYLAADPTFQHYTIEDAPLRLIALDSVQSGKVGGELCAARLDWLAQRLAEQPARPTLVFLHHPPFSTGIAHIDAHTFLGTAAFAAVIGRHPQVERVIAGHVHRSMQLKWAGTLASTCPSTAHQFTLDLRPGEPATYVLETPGFQLHHWREKFGLITHTVPLGDFPPPRRLRN